MNQNRPILLDAWYSMYVVGTVHCLHIHRCRIRHSVLSVIGVYKEFAPPDRTASRLGEISCPLPNTSTHNQKILKKKYRFYRWIIIHEIVLAIKNDAS